MLLPARAVRDWRRERALAAAALLLAQHRRQQLCAHKWPAGRCHRCHPTVPRAGHTLPSWALAVKQICWWTMQLGQHEHTLGLLQATRSEASSRCSEALSLSWAPTSRP